MPLSVVFAPEAQSQLIALYHYIADQASPEVARGFTDAIAEYCEGVASFPKRGSRRDDIRLGLRIVGFRRRVAIAFTCDERVVTILGIFYGGQNYEAILPEEDPP